MSSIEKFVGTALGAMVVCVSAIPNAYASASFLINNEASLSVQAPGFSYVNSGPQASALTVNTDGYLLCANVYPDIPPVNQQVTFTPAHQDTSFAPAHAWKFDTSFDVQAVSYNGSVLTVNRGAGGMLATTLACHAVSASGTVTSGTSDGIFDSGMDTPLVTNSGHLVNWNPTQGFDWNAPDWTQVPVDACDSQSSQHVNEDVACAAATGAKSQDGTRAAIMATATDATTFIYAFHVDAHFGTQVPQGPQDKQSLLPTQTTQMTDASNTATIVLGDAYDSAFLKDSAHYCILTTLPATLDGNVCNGVPAALQGDVTGPLHYRFSVAPYPVGSGRASFYVALKRPLSNSTHANPDTPAVAAAVLVDPVLVAEGGNHFTGDDMVFGFIPGSAGFSWMSGL